MTPESSERRARRRTAFAVFVALFVIYNANGREIGTVDSQPEKFTAREIAVNGTLRLDRVVAERPALAERAAFALDRHGHYRSAYPILPALLAAVPAIFFQVTGLVDMDAPLAANLVAALTASLATAAAVALVFLSISRLVSRRIALLTAIGLGLGTNYWTLVSQTLWQHETVALGVAIGLWAWLRPAEDLRARHAWIGGLGLAMAGAARPQIAPLIVVLWAWLAARTGLRRAAAPAAIIAGLGVVQMIANYQWFGDVLGATPRLEAMHPQYHGVTGSLSREPWVGAAGLLLSPSRGLVPFSPVALVALAGVRLAWTHTRDFGLRWLLLAAAVQFVAYAFYSVWWAGHTYGPRYLLDVLVPLAPVAAMGASRIAQSRAATAVALLLLAWSVLVAGVGAFVYPNDHWNTDPNDVDQYHERLWDFRDSQIPRAFRSQSSPQNFDLFARAAVRRSSN